MRDVPCWFMHQVSESSDMSFHAPQTGLNLCLGIIVWLNVDPFYSYMSGFSADIRVIEPHTNIIHDRWSFETSAWKPVPQSYLIIIPQQEEFKVKYGERVGVSVDLGLEIENIGGHVFYYKDS